MGNPPPADQRRARFREIRAKPEQASDRADHIKGVPGRKSDINDAIWIADLLAHNMIRPSFVPPQPIQSCAI